MSMKFTFRQSGLKIRRMTLMGGYLYITLWNTQKVKVLARVAKSLGLLLVSHGEDGDGNPFVCYQKQDVVGAAD